MTMTEGGARSRRNRRKAGDSTSRETLQGTSQDAAERTPDEAGSAGAEKAPEPLAGGPSGADEETVRIARKDFRRRRFAGRRRRLRTLGALVLVLALVSAGLWAVFFSPYVSAEKVQVSGNDAVRRSQIERSARVPVGTPLARVDLDAIAARVESIPAVRRAEVSRGWPHDVRIRVLERTPVAVIDRGNGLQAMDSRGILFGGYAQRPRGLPLVKSAAGTRAEALTEAGRVLGALPAEVARKVDYLEVATVDQIRLVLKNGRTVIWGSVEASPQKAAVLAVLLKRPGREIDVSVPGRPTTR